MKVFIIHLNGNKKSEQYANAALKSFELYSGWEPVLFNGLSPQTLAEQEILPHKLKSRAELFFALNDDQVTYTTKMCCSLNHYNLFKRCVELNEPITVIEHDAHCIGSWVDVEFKDVLILNYKSALTLQHVLTKYKQYALTQNGISYYNVPGLIYKYDNAWSDGCIMPGTAAYSITPVGAQKMLDVYHNYGWEQSDHIINTHNVNIQVLTPELFTFKLPNLAMSHGIVTSET